MQVNDIGLLDAREKLLASLPIFHSFGFTITIWFPILHGIPIITVPSPLDTKGITKAIKAEQATILLGTPTFFRPYFKRTKPEDLASLKYVVAGAEKTPSGFGERWQEHFNCGYLEGYGLTETSPVAAVNLPNPACTTSTATPQPASRTNSAGRLIQGMAARVVSPDTGTPLPLGETGMLQLKGPNIFPGYLNDPVRTGEVFQDGWFVSGDLGRFDEDGFLFIEGRLSRFSKIGGEMVPHGAVEQHVVEAFGFENADAPQVAIAGVADEARGEALVLLTVVPITREELREKLTAAGLPNLWIPKKISQIEKIPCLPTGKLDLRGLSDAATQA